jgi:hypothetical protein
MTQGFPVRDPIWIDDLPGLATIEQLDELLVHGPRLWMRESTVLVKDGGVAPLLELAKTANQTAGSVLALVAVDQDWVVAAIEQNC